jgi:hypothetical protein
MKFSKDQLEYIIEMLETCQSTISERKDETKEEQLAAGYGTEQSQAFGEGVGLGFAWGVVNFARKTFQKKLDKLSDGRVNHNPSQPL